jgi:hypothetical protein
MAVQINLQPQTLDLALYAGDGFAVQLTCKDKTGAPVDLTGAVTAQIRLDRLHPDDEPITSFTASMVDAWQGIVKLSLTGAQTAALSAHPSSKGGKFSGVWDVEWAAVDAEPRTICQGKVECVADVTR